MPLRTRLVILFLLLVALVSAGCSRSADAPQPVAPTAEQMPTAIAAATLEPTPAPTPAPPPDPIQAAVPLDPTTWPAAAAGTVSVDAGQTFGPVSPWVFGTNFDPGMTVPLDLLDTATETMGVRFIRFPGGGYGDLNTILPKQYDDFIKLARTLGAEPHIHVRFLERTPADAAEVVRYINLEKGYGVRYWAIGNEPPYFYRDVTPEQFAVAWREFAAAMLAVDPTITLVGPDISQFGPEARAAVASDVAEAREWMRVFLEANGDLIGLVTWHRYPFPLRSGLETTSIEGLRPYAAEFDVTIRELRQMVRETTGRNIPLGLLEVNSDSSRGISGEATPDSPFAAVWLTDVFGRLIRHGVPVGAQYAFQTRDSRGGWGLLNRSSVRPQFYTYQLFRRFGQELVYAATDDPLVTAYAARRDDGALTLLVVNLGDVAAAKPLALAGHPGGPAEVFRLDAAVLDRLPPTGSDMSEVRETAELADGALLQLPPRSATLYVIP